MNDFSKLSNEELLDALENASYWEEEGDRETSQAAKEDVKALRAEILRRMK